MRPPEPYARLRASGLAFEVLGISRLYATGQTAYGVGIHERLSEVDFIRADQLTDDERTAFGLPIVDEARVFARPLDPRAGNEWEQIGTAAEVRFEESGGEDGLRGEEGV